MSKVNVIRAWKDAEYSNRLGAGELRPIPPNPVGQAEWVPKDDEDEGLTSLCTRHCNLKIHFPAVSNQLFE